MLRNAYLLAKIGADTAENERNVAEICQTLATTPPDADAAPQRARREPLERRGGREPSVKIK